LSSPLSGLGQSGVRSVAPPLPAEQCSGFGGSFSTGSHSGRSEQLAVLVCVLC
jgi:hypothetical protein